jgi:hypothetical protein
MLGGDSLRGQFDKTETFCKEQSHLYKGKGSLEKYVEKTKRKPAEPVPAPETRMMKNLNKAASVLRSTKKSATKSSKPPILKTAQSPERNILKMSILSPSNADLRCLSPSGGSSLFLSTP